MTLKHGKYIGRKQSETVFIDPRSGRFGIRFHDADGALRTRLLPKGTKETTAWKELAFMQRSVKEAVREGLTSVDTYIQLRVAAKSGGKSLDEAIRDAKNQNAPKTVSDAAKEYMEHQKSRRTKETLRRYESILDNHLLPHFGNLLLKDVRPSNVRQYIDARLNKGKEPATVRQEIMVLSGIYSYMAEDQPEITNPVSCLREKPTPTKKVKRYLMWSEEPKLLLALPEPVRTVVMVAIDTGLREGELTKLLWKDVLFDRNILIARETKNGDDRAVPMTPRVAEALKKLQRLGPQVFISRELKPFARFNSDAWRRARDTAGIAPFRFHDLRVTFGTRAALAKVDPFDIKELMGHKNINTTMLYINLAGKNKADAMKSFDTYSQTFRERVSMSGGMLNDEIRDTHSAAVASR